jgi:predicted negative regulator of RcsB-dependent stress response
VDIYASEEEQVEALKKWWKENGRSIIAGAIIGIGGVLGWKGWIEYQDQRSVQASSQYEQLVKALKDDKKDLSEKIVKQIKSEYKSTPYAVMSVLHVAKYQVGKADLIGAIASLKWAYENTNTAEIKHVTRLRLATAYIESNKIDEAYKLIKDVNQGSFTALYEDLLGDIHALKNEPAKARNNYQAALLMGTKNRQFIQMKLDDLGLVSVVEK